MGFLLSGLVGPRNAVTRRGAEVTLLICIMEHLLAPKEGRQLVD